VGVCLLHLCELCSSLDTSTVLVADILGDRVEQVLVVVGLLDEAGNLELFEILKGSLLDLFERQPAVPQVS